jgi:hypothetical protein
MSHGRSGKDTLLHELDYEFERNTFYKREEIKEVVPPRYVNAALRLMESSLTFPEERGDKTVRGSFLERVVSSYAERLLSFKETLRAFNRVNNVDVTQHNFRQIYDRVCADFSDEVPAKVGSGRVKLRLLKKRVSMQAFFGSLWACYEVNNLARVAKASVEPLQKGNGKTDPQAAIGYVNHLLSDERSTWLLFNKARYPGDPDYLAKLESAILGRAAAFSYFAQEGGMGIKKLEHRLLDGLLEEMYCHVSPDDAKSIEDKMLDKYDVGLRLANFDQPKVELETKQKISGRAAWDALNDTDDDYLDDDEDLDEDLDDDLDDV